MLPKDEPVAAEWASSDLEMLKTVPLFDGLGPREIAGLRAIMDELRFAPGQVIIREGERGDDFHILVNGNAQCVVMDAGGHELVLDEYTCGGFFGELSMLTGEPRSARIKALDAVTTLALDRDEFFKFLQEHPSCAINVLETLGKRLHRTDTLLRRTVSRNVNEVVEEELTRGERITEVLANFSGTLKFLVSTFCGLVRGWSGTCPGFPVLISTRRHTDCWRPFSGWKRFFFRFSSWFRRTGRKKKTASRKKSTTKLIPKPKWKLA